MYTLLNVKSYYDFYSEIYPDTHDILKPGVSSLKWLHGQNAEQNKIGLNVETQNVVLNKCNVRNPFASETSNGNTTPVPVVSSKNVEPAVNPAPNNTNTFKSNVSITLKPINDQPPPAYTPATTNNATSSTVPTTNGNHNTTKVAPVSNGNHTTTQQPPSEPQYIPAAPVFRNTVTANGTSSNGTTNGNHGPNVTNSTTSAPAVAPKPVDRSQKTKSVYYQSKYKYIDGKAAHKSEHITNIRNLSTMWPSECNGFQINTKHAAFLLSSTSGQIGVVEVIKQLFVLNA